FDSRRLHYVSRCQQATAHVKTLGFPRVFAFLDPAGEICLHRERSDDRRVPLCSVDVAVAGQHPGQFRPMVGRVRGACLAPFHSCDFYSASSPALTAASCSPVGRIDSKYLRTVWRCPRGSGSLSSTSSICLRYSAYRSL